MSDKINVNIRQADLSQSTDAADFLRLLEGYALDPLGGGEPLDPEVRKILPDKLAGRPGSWIFFAEIDGRAVGLCNVFEGFSTFAGAPLLNIHDVFVEEEWRGKGVAGCLFEAVEQLGRDQGCSKLTLEVLEGNASGKQCYSRQGFRAFVLDEQYGAAEFWQKYLK